MIIDIEMVRCITGGRDNHARVSKNRPFFSQAENETVGQKVSESRAKNQQDVGVEVKAGVGRVGFKFEGQG